ncbi:hypothetical protein VE04_05334 [Pseudogymnoascus sp. 24MN13]|nr:hypothetical protein VE04_05334 [Pseudogymnoascus sp. 24MN13]
MATDRLNNLTQQQLTEAVQQIVDSPKFWVNNGHIPVEIRRQIKEDILKGKWGPAPIFSPYAATHDGYSQVRYQNVKMLVHRVTFRHMYGTQLNPALEISHIVNCGSRSTSNINPLHMVEEPSILNRSRICCFLFMDDNCRESLPAPVEQTESYINSTVSTIYALNAPCRRLHAPQCQLDWNCWFQAPPENR